MDAVLEKLLNDEEELNGTWGFGTKGCPIRNYTGGYIAYFLQKYDLAGDLLEKAIHSGRFKVIDETLRKDFEHIKKCQSE